MEPKDIIDQPLNGLPKNEAVTPDPFVTFQKFNNKTDADLFCALLETHRIPYQLDNNTLLNNLEVYSQDSWTKDIRVQLRKSDFENVRSILEQESQLKLEELETDYYLLTYTNEELMEILEKQDEWNPFDINLARKLLKDKGIEIDEEQMDQFRQNRIGTLSQPETSNGFLNGFWIFIGYLCALSGGLLGFMIGWYLLTSKKTLPNGEQVYSWDDATRKHGKAIFILSIICLFTVLCIKIGPLL